ncbi:unnamed protein product, partial [Closterium sp. NIES-54]
LTFPAYGSGSLNRLHSRGSGLHASSLRLATTTAAAPASAVSAMVAAGSAAFSVLMPSLPARSSCPLLWKRAAIIAASSAAAPCCWKAGAVGAGGAGGDAAEVKAEAAAAGEAVEYALPSPPTRNASRTLPSPPPSSLVLAPCTMPSRAPSPTPPPARDSSSASTCAPQRATMAATPSTAARTATSAGGGAGGGATGKGAGEAVGGAEEGKTWWGVKEGGTCGGGYHLHSSSATRPSQKPRSTAAPLPRPCPTPPIHTMPCCPRLPWTMKPPPASTRGPSPSPSSSSSSTSCSSPAGISGAHGGGGRGGEPLRVPKEGAVKEENGEATHTHLTGVVDVLILSPRLLQRPDAKPPRHPPTARRKQRLPAAARPAPPTQNRLSNPPSLPRPPCRPLPVLCSHSPENREAGEAGRGEGGKQG